MDGDRTILHCDCNGFFASVECAELPILATVPMAVGGDPESRHGIILAKNELAKKYNIQTVETIGSARRKCPDLVVVPPRHRLYREYSERVMSIYRRYTDLVEPFSLDEAWLDVTASRRLFGDGKKIADELRSVVKREVGITISVGVSFCKMFAKLGSDYKKPDATTVFSRENWQEMIFPLPVSDMMYVGASTAAALKKMGIHTIGELAATPEALLAARFKKAGKQLHMYANGLDFAPVKSVYDKEEIKSVGNGMTFREDLIGEAAVKSGVKTLAESVGERLRAHKLKCRTVQVHIKDPSFKTRSKQTTLKYPTQSTRDIRDTAFALIRDTFGFSAPIRALTITAANLIPEDIAAVQLDLFDDTPDMREKVEKLDKTVDELKRKFGRDIIS